MASPQAKRNGAIGGVAAAIIAATVALEGGWVNNPADPGGETNLGITKRVAVDHGYTGPMRSLPRGVAESIYYETYLVKPGYAPLIDVDAAVTEELFDTTVNMGAPRPSRWFQQSINMLCDSRLAEDGKVGPGTIAAYVACQSKVGSTPLCEAMLEQLDRRQLAEYDRLVRVNPKLRAFYKGWIAHRIGNVDRGKCGARVVAADVPVCVTVRPSPLLQEPNSNYDYRLPPGRKDGGTT
jgi:lysozyme family protein